jgi:hypothetical protein
MADEDTIIKIENPEVSRLRPNVAMSSSSDARLAYLQLSLVFEGARQAVEDTGI